MAEDWAVDDAADYDKASRELLRRLARKSEQMAAAEPGTDEFLTAYVESCRLQEMYHQVRGTWRAPVDIWEQLPAESGYQDGGEVEDGLR